MNIYKQLFDKKYRFFRRKMADVQKSIWESEFKIDKSRQVREGVRQDRDRAVEAALRVESAIKGATDTGEAKKLEDEKAAFDENVRRYEAQMKMIDEQIHGVPAKGEDPGQNGIMDTVKSLVELREMYKSHIKNI